MIPLTAATATAGSNTNPWLGSIYAGVITAVIATVMVLLGNNIYLFFVFWLICGLAPVLGAAIATGKTGGSVGALIGGIIGNIPILNIILWPLLVGLLGKGASFGKLFLWNLIGIVLGIVVFFVVMPINGQDPSWFWPSLVLAISFWGGTLGAILTASVGD